MSIQSPADYPTGTLDTAISNPASLDAMHERLPEGLDCVHRVRIGVQVFLCRANRRAENPGNCWIIHGFHSVTPALRLNHFLHNSGRKPPHNNRRHPRYEQR